MFEEQDKTNTTPNTSSAAANVSETNNRQTSQHPPQQHPRPERIEQKSREGRRGRWRREREETTIRAVEKGREEGGERKDEKTWRGTGKRRKRMEEG